MKRTPIFQCVILFATMVVTLPVIAGAAPESPIWSRGATRLELGGSLHCVKVPSPDSRKTVVVRTAGFEVIVSGKPALLPKKAWIYTPAELLWAPDSSAFVVTQSDGGDVGTWFVAVYGLDGNTVARLDVSSAVIESFQKRYPCDEPEPPNVGAVAWLEDSKRLLLAAEVPPHSNCREMGKLGGFVVEVPGGRIVQELSEAELHAKWGNFPGARLGAPLRQVGQGRRP